MNELCNHYYNQSDRCNVPDTQGIYTQIYKPSVYITSLDVLCTVYIGQVIYTTNVHIRNSLNVHNIESIAMRISTFHASRNGPIFIRLNGGDPFICKDPVVQLPRANAIAGYRRENLCTSMCLVLTVFKASFSSTGAVQNKTIVCRLGGRVTTDVKAVVQ